MSSQHEARPIPMPMPMPILIPIPIPTPAPATGPTPLPCLSFIQRGTHQRTNKRRTHACTDGKWALATYMVGLESKAPVGFTGGFVVGGGLRLGFALSFKDARMRSCMRARSPRQGYGWLAGCLSCRSIYWALLSGDGDGAWDMGYGHRTGHDGA